MPSDIIVHVGLKLSGKSHKAKEFLKGQRAFIWDPNNEYPTEYKYVPKTQDLATYEQFCKEVWDKMSNCWIVTDEAHNVLKNGMRDLPPHANNLFTRCRHKGFGLLFIGWRPAMMQPDIMEQADRLIIFEMHGANNIKRLNNIHQGMGDDADTKLGDYRYIDYDGRGYTIKDPVK